MKISFFTHINASLTSNGFGTAGFHIITSLDELGCSVKFNDPSAPIELQFTQPSDYQNRSGQHTIGYTPWESSAFKPEWQGKVDTTDSLWATSEWTKEVFESNGYPVDYIYHHGVSPLWSPLRRRAAEKIRFLHIGGDAPRKSAQLVFDVFVELFGNDPKYELTLKSLSNSSVRYELDGVGVVPPTYFNNVKVINEDYSEDRMVALMHQHHVLVYPSYGEGFGFIPLQALATGMPVIFNTTWAPYKNYSVGLDVSDRVVPSPWPAMHPGNMLEPSRKDVRSQMLSAAHNFNAYSTLAFEQAPAVHNEYSWKKVTGQALRKMVEYL